MKARGTAAVACVDVSFGQRCRVVEIRGVEVFIDRGAIVYSGLCDPHEKAAALRAKEVPREGEFIGE